MPVKQKTIECNQNNIELPNCALYIVLLILFIFIFAVAESIMQAQVYNKSKYFVMSRFFFVLMKQQIH
jgi:hypothetical protein